MPEIRTYKIPELIVIERLSHKLPDYSTLDYLTQVVRNLGLQGLDHLQETPRVGVMNNGNTAYFLETGTQRSTWLFLNGLDTIEAETRHIRMGSTDHEQFKQKARENFGIGIYSPVDLADRVRMQYDPGRFSMLGEPKVTITIEDLLHCRQIEL